MAARIARVPFVNNGHCLRWVSLIRNKLSDFYDAIPIDGVQWIIADYVVNGLPLLLDPLRLGKGLDISQGDGSQVHYHSWHPEMDSSFVHSTAALGGWSIGELWSLGATEFTVCFSPSPSPSACNSECWVGVAARDTKLNSSYFQNNVLATNLTYCRNTGNFSQCNFAHGRFITTTIDAELLQQYLADHVGSPQNAITVRFSVPKNMVTFLGCDRKTTSFRVPDLASFHPYIELWRVGSSAHFVHPFLTADPPIPL
jgi:hypothetical protein